MENVDFSRVHLFFLICTYIALCIWRNPVDRFVEEGLTIASVFLFFVDVAAYALFSIGWPPFWTVVIMRKLLPEE
jgi:hypothetical protein